MWASICGLFEEMAGELFGNEPYRYKVRGTRSPRYKTRHRVLQPYAINSLFCLNFLICKLGIVVLLLPILKYFCEDWMRIHLNTFYKWYSTIDGSRLSIIFITIVIIDNIS